MLLARVYYCIKEIVPKQLLNGKISQVKRTLSLLANYFIIKFSLTAKRVSRLLSIANKGLHLRSSLIIFILIPGNTFLHLLNGEMGPIFIEGLLGFTFNLYNKVAI